ncbi:MAG: gamma-glutamyltransferase [Synergistaceae bacterium]|nr:gamma-glutamyltransferase [Synergistaceae bacterium]
MAVTTHPLADMDGQAILDSGGNAIDATVAVGYALAVVHPQAGNIGGGGFAIIHTADGKDYALDLREMALGAATRDMYLDESGNVIPLESTRTYEATGIPGTVAGMSAMLDRFGTKNSERLWQWLLSLRRKATSSQSVKPGQW